VNEPKVCTIGLSPFLVSNREKLLVTDPRKSKFPGKAVELYILVGPERSPAKMPRLVAGIVLATVAEPEKKLYPTSKKSLFPQGIQSLPTKMLL